MTRALILAAGLVALTAGAAAAKPFQQADRNGNDVIEYDEASRAYPGVSQGQFRRIDMNRDGVIDRDEYPQLDAIWELLMRAR